jgi:hypothetical protein
VQMQTRPKLQPRFNDADVTVTVGLHFNRRTV